MKIILTGATGFIGHEILTQCLHNPYITTLILLSRRPIENLSPHAKAKVKVIIMKDFKSYPEWVIHEMSDADACIWAMGTYDGNPEVEVDYPHAFCQAILQGRKGGRFRHVHLGGAFTVEDQTKSLWFLETARKGRGLGELRMRNFPKENGCEESWETFIMRPAGVLKQDKVKYLNWAVPNCLMGSDECAASMINVALNGSKEGGLNHSVMLSEGRILLGQ